MSAIGFEHVTFTYPGGTRRVLADVSVNIPEGSFVLVVGPTGGGKSTLLRAVNGLVPHFTGGTYAGRVLVAGRSTTSHAPRDLADVVAFVPQDPDASFVLDRVEDELAYAMENLGVDAGTMRRRVEEILDALDLEALRDRSVRSLSGGEKQRVAIAASLTPGAKVLILDEPTSQLDPQGAEDVLAALARLVHDHGYTVLAAEHRLERVVGFADLVCGVPGDGSVDLGPPQDVFGRLELGPPVAHLARPLGWDRIPLTVRDARRLALDSQVSLPAPPTAAPAVKGPILLEASRVEADYGSRVVLKSIDLALHAGEIVALMGRNGSGKTTLLRSLAGVHALSAGHVTLSGTAPVPGVDVALVPQSPDSILFRERVDDEIAVAPRTDEHRVAALMENLGIEDLAGRHPRDLSAGQRALVAIAAMSATGARVLLMDEPTRGLDVAGKARLVAFARSFVSENGAICIATHDVELAAELADRVVMLAKGEVIADGLPSDVLGDSVVFAPQTARVFGPQWLTPRSVMAAVGSTS